MKKELVIIKGYINSIYGLVSEGDRYHILEMIDALIEHCDDSQKHSVLSADIIAEQSEATARCLSEDHTDSIRLFKKCKVCGHTNT